MEQELKVGQRVKITKILKSLTDNEETYYEYPEDAQRIIDLMDMYDYNYPRAMLTVLFENDFVIERISEYETLYKYYLTFTDETTKKILRLNDGADSFFDDFDSFLHDNAFCAKDLTIVTKNFKFIKTLLEK